MVLTRQSGRHKGWTLIGGSKCTRGMNVGNIEVGGCCSGSEEKAVVLSLEMWCSDPFQISFCEMLDGERWVFPPNRFVGMGGLGWIDGGWDFIGRNTNFETSRSIIQ